MESQELDMNYRLNHHDVVVPDLLSLLLHPFLSTQLQAQQLQLPGVPWTFLPCPHWWSLALPICQDADIYLSTWDVIVWIMLSYADSSFQFKYYLHKDYLCHSFSLICLLA